MGSGFNEVEEEKVISRISYLVIEPSVEKKHFKTPMIIPSRAFFICFKTHLDSLVWHSHQPPLYFVCSAN